MTRLAPLIFEIPAWYIERHHRHRRTYDDGDGVKGDGTHIVLALVCQVTRSREYFDDTDHTEEEEYHPDDLVTLEEVANFLIHI